MTQPQVNPEQAAQGRAKIEAMKRNFEQKRALAESLSKIKYKVGVYSGKGGVGKTTVAVNLATTFAQDGTRVGLFDVDIDCPNVVRAMTPAAPLDSNHRTAHVKFARVSTRIGLGF